MKNKRLVTILGLLAVLAIGGIVYSSLNSKGNTTKTSGDSQTVKVGVLQYVSHPSLDLIYKGIQDGLAEEGYKGDSGYDSLPRERGNCPCSGQPD